MNFEFSEEQEMLRDSLARFLREKYDFETRQGIIKSEGRMEPRDLAAICRDGLDGRGLPGRV